jgi:glycosyltransferase 2 family protein
LVPDTSPFSSSFIIPGSLGAQDGGNVLLLRAFGYSDVTGIAFTLLRRFRELAWGGIGLLCLAMIGKKGIAQEQV